MSPEGQEASHSPSDDLQAGDQAPAPSFPASPGSLLFFRVSLYLRLFNSAAFIAGWGGGVDGLGDPRLCLMQTCHMRQTRSHSETGCFFFSHQWQDKQIPTYTGFQLPKLPKKSHHTHTHTLTHIHTQALTIPPVAALSEDP